MRPKPQFYFVLALALHGILIFGVSTPKLPVHVKEKETAPVEVELVAVRPEEPPPPPEPAPDPLPKPVEEVQPEPPPVLPEPSPAPEPEPTPIEPVAAPILQETVTPSPSEFQVTAIKPETPVETRPVDVPIAAPVITNVPVVRIKAEARYRKNPEPQYPLQAKRRRQEGLVLLQVFVDPRGAATEIQVKQSSGFSTLDNAALEGVRVWEFEPATVDGVPVPSEVEVPVRFRLAK